MPNQMFSKRTYRATAITLVTIAATSFGGLAGLAATQYLVSQKGRDFNPHDLTIKRGESVTIVNDDADLRHHAYIDSERFNFDSGDQEPGSKINIAFPVAGTFEVLCAIHPKMKLRVKVE